MRGPAQRLLELVDQAGTTGISQAEVATLIGITDAEAEALIGRMLAAARAWLADDARLYSTAPFEDTSA